MDNVYYLGDSVPLYVKFVDEYGEDINVTNAKVRILHTHNNETYEDLEWTDLTPISINEFLYNYKIPMDSDLGQYHIIYVAEENEKTASKIETINVIAKNANYINPIKIFGYIENIKDHTKIDDAKVEIFDNNNKVYESYSNIDGYWEAFLYPNDYIFTFFKSKFAKKEVSVKINEELQEQQFETIGLNLENDKRGNGSFKISETFKSKMGMPLFNLSISVFDILDPNKIIGEDVTDNKGEFTCFLNEGTYILKANGKSNGSDFNKTFKLKVEYNGKFDLTDLSKNIAMLTNMEIVGNGKGLIKVEDSIMDKNGNGIIDVQINALDKKNNLIAQDYTDPNGKWCLYLDPGEYTIEYYHPNFKTITEKRIIK